MQQITGQIWTFYSIGFPITVTTNSVINARGENVMGKGIALEAKERFPRLPRMVAENLKRFGNRTYFYPEFNLFSFPTKYHWSQPSDLNLIEESTITLKKIVDLRNIELVYLAAPGIGNGKLSWDSVHPILEEYLDERFIVVL